MMVDSNRNSTTNKSAFNKKEATVEDSEVATVVASKEVTVVASEVAAEVASEAETVVAPEEASEATVVAQEEVSEEDVAVVAAAEAEVETEEAPSTDIDVLKIKFTIRFAPSLLFFACASIPVFICSSPPFPFRLTPSAPSPVFWPCKT